MESPAVLAIVTLMFATNTGIAQTLNQGNMAPVVGDVLSEYQAPYIAPGPAGANQTWDFSTLITGTVVTKNYMTAASTGYSTFFSNANLAADHGQGIFVFYWVNNNSLEFVGIYFADASFARPYQNPVKVMTYPCSFNTTWTDNFSSNYTFSGTAVMRTGTITGAADGFGTVVMPYGPVTNVLRVRVEETYTDVHNYGYSVNSSTTHHFYKPGITSGPILSILEDTMNQNSNPQTHRSSLWRTTAPAGILERNADAIGIDLFPNPATDQLSIVFGSVGGSTRLELLDATGRLVRSEHFAAMPMGINRVDLDVNEIPAGTYVVRIIAANGDQGAKRLVVQ